MSLKIIPSRARDKYTCAIVVHLLGIARSLSCSSPARSTRSLKLYCSLCHLGTAHTAGAGASAATKYSMVRLLAATRLLLERRNFLLATTLASRALATTSSQLQLRPGEATSDDEKTIYFVRHAEGYHNKGERELPNWKTDQLGLDPKYRDARLTPAGIAQSEALNKDLRKRSVPPPELVVVSTLSRTIQTAQTGFKDLPGWPTTFVGTELCRERISVHECDHRRTLTDLKKDFPFVDFSLVKDEDDALWTTRKENEPSEMAATLCYERAEDFLRWLKARPEQSIAVVAHWVFLKHMFTAHAADPALATNFKNAELRTAALFSGSGKVEL